MNRKFRSRVRGVFFNVCVFVCLSAFQHALAQPCDTVLLQANVLIADSLAQSKKFEEAIVWRQKNLALLSVCNPPDYESLIRTHHQLARLYRISAASYDSAKVHINTGISLAEALLPESHILVDVYNEKGIIHFYLSELEPAYNAYQKGLNLFQKLEGTEHPRVSGFAVNMALCLEGEERYDEALALYLKALQIRKAAYHDCDPVVATVYYNMGMLFHRRGLYYEALQYYAQTLSIWEETLDPNDTGFAGLYNNIGVCHQYRGDFQQARILLEKARDILLYNYGPNHPEVATATNNLGLNFVELGDYNRALIYFQSAMRIREEKLGPGHPLVATVYNNIGNCYRHRKDYPTAFIWLKKALGIRLEHYGTNDHTDVADSYNDLGLFYENTYQYDQALLHFRKALEISLRQLGPDHPLVADAHARIGQVFLLTKQYSKALYHFHEALRIREMRFGVQHPEVRQLYAQLASCYPDHTAEALALCDKALSGLENAHTQALTALMAHAVKSKILLSAYHQSNDAAYLLQADTCLQNAQQWFDRSRFSFREAGSKQLLYDRFFNLFEMGMEVYYQLQQRFPEMPWIDRALQIQEKSRNVLLQEALQLSQAEAFSGLPDSLLQQERTLRLDIAYYEQLYLQNETDLLRKQLFQTRQQYYQLLDSIRAHYPAYFQLRYGFQTPDIKQLRSGMLENGTCLLSYFWGEQHLYLLLVDADTSVLIQLDNPVRIAALVADLRGQILPFDPLLMASDQACHDYAQTAWLLYQSLLEPVAPLIRGKKLHIIPDGPLSALPFEALLPEIPDHIKGWKSLPYLIHQYPINYSFSTGLMRSELSSRRKAKKTFLGVAPDFPERLDSLSGMPLSISLMPLQVNQSEVANIHKLLGGRALLGSQATSSQFVLHAPDYRILHLATHALANDSLGAFSLLAFSAEESPEYLLVRDLYNLSLNAELVVLSACETALGEWQRGEGMISLARGFFYAGTRSLLTTLWTVDDEQTAAIMLNYYQYLQQGNSKDQALRLAKTDYLKANSALRNHPYYWASFIPMGDSAPLKLTQPYGWLPWLSIGLVGLLLGLIWRQRKRPAQKFG